LSAMTLAEAAPTRKPSVIRAIVKMMGFHI
jgi:hypothetical protein